MLALCIRAWTFDQTGRLTKRVRMRMVTPVAGLSRRSCPAELDEVHLKWCSTFPLSLRRCLRKFNVIECRGVRGIGSSFDPDHVAGLQGYIAHDVPGGVIAVGVARRQRRIGGPACVGSRRLAIDG